MICVKQMSKDNEIEIFMKNSDSISITPNVQFVMDPGGAKSESPATVFGLRCRIKF